MPYNPALMLSFFRRSPSYANREFSDLSFMLIQEQQRPSYKRELLDERKLDFSTESLKHLDQYLEALHAAPPKKEDLVVVVLRCGAYVGEVIRKNSPSEINWVAFEEAAKYSDYVKGLGHSLGTAGILWVNAKTMCFPLAKICKFIENGNEDSVYFFAEVILKDWGKDWGRSL
jgi:hypothetical protein